ncbi:MAG: FHA domain-containing protein [Actinobacteria bacterium]|nr:FHA domain-containing protein [Actinomycetota bacterium]
MELGLGLSVPATGARADVVVRARDGACLAEVAPVLLTKVLPAGRTGQLSVGGVPLRPETLLGAPPLVQGALLLVDAPPEPPLPDGLPALLVVGGPDAGAVHALTGGPVVVGRGPDARMRLDDEQVSREHCRLDLRDGAATVVDLGSANGTGIDGSPVGPGAVALPEGAVLRIGSSSLVLTGPAEPAAPLSPTGDGRLAYHRPPRLRPPRELVQVVVPARPEARDRAPIPMLAVLAPVVLGVVLWQVTGSTTFLLFTLLSPVLVLGNVVTDRRSGKRLTRKQLAVWRAERHLAETRLEAAVRADEQTRRAACPDAAQTLLTALGPGLRLWERRRGDDDTLDVRVGLADQPAHVEAEGDLREGCTTARDVPVVVALTTAGVLGIGGDRSRAQALARWVVVQAAVWHSPRDLQVVVLAEPSAAGAWDWAGWLPHVRPDGRQGCGALFGLGPAQAAARVAELTVLVEARVEQARSARGAGTDDRCVLVVIDGAHGLRTVAGLAAVLTAGRSVGVFAVCVESDPRLLPEQCGATAVLTGSACVAVRATGSPTVGGAAADLLSSARAEAVARALAPLRDDSRDRSEGLPPSVRWTDTVELMLVGGDEDASRVLERWAAPGCSTTAVLGRGADGPFAVDLSRDGPHALVAGTTGSGKSELLQTLIASLALTNRPDELTFVLVDYKGGAAFGPCAELPHTVGMVTDLDGTLVERALASLGAELSRREAVLLAAGAKDIEEHRRLVRTPGGPREVLPRLVLVVDEFASLAEELPDFVGGLVGIAMRGRSLGVHLVLATQRPEGVVSADIRANTNLRLCLAVTRDTESRDVLDSPLAATISRTTPGRAYARTGHTDLALFQAGRVGGRRPSSTTGEQPATVELLPAAERGDPVGRPGAAETAEGSSVTDLSLLVAACSGAAARLGLPPPRSPWLAPLPPVVLARELPSVPDPLAGTPGRVPPLAYGLIDVPTEQEQCALVFDLDRSTHLMVLGSPRSGRTTTLRTLAGAVAAVASPDDLHLYALDPGGGGLGPLAALPHAGAVVTRDQPERLARVLAWLAAEVERRQDVLSCGGHTDLTEQRTEAAPDQRLPHLLLLVDRWEAFLAGYQDLDGGRLVDLFFRLLREGPSVGLHVVLSADRSGIVGRIGSMVEDKLLLRLADRGDYVGAGLPTRLVPHALPPGRGWSMGGAPLVAQVALLDTDPSGPAQAAALARLAAAAPPPTRRRPRRVELLPTSVRRRDLPLPDGPLSVVIGVGGDELEPVAVDLSDVAPGLLLAGPPRSGRSTTLLTFAAGLRAGGLPIVAVAPRASPLRELPGCLLGTESGPALEALLGSDGRVALLVDDAELLVESALAPALEQAVRRARDVGTIVLVAGTTDELVAGYRGFVLDLRRSRAGILLSPQSAGDGDLLGVRLSRTTGGDVRPGRGLLVRRGRVEPLQVAH